MGKLVNNIFYPTKKNGYNDYFTFRSDKEFTFHIWKNSTTARHEHENYVEIFIVTKGSISNTMLGETQILSPGHIGVIYPGVVHVHEKINDDEVQLINITCSSEKTLMLLREIYHDNKNANSIIFKLSKDELSLVKSFRNMILSSSGVAQYNSLISAFFIYLLGLLPKTNKENIEITNIPENLQNFLLALQNMDLSYIKINELYKLSNYSQRALSDFFQKYLKKTLVQYVTELKLNKAKNLLLFTDMHITEICLKSGFNSISHFNHTFKKHYGFSPKDYRNKNQQI